MFGIDFYPTPREVIDRILMDVEVSGKYILEPSAGSGNIVKALKEKGAKEVIACEIDPRLRKVLSGECTVIADDFLTVTRVSSAYVGIRRVRCTLSSSTMKFGQSLISKSPKARGGNYLK